MKDFKLLKRCDRNRKRSQRRAIYCPVHGCYLHSVSQKYRLFASHPGQLQQKGIGRQNAKILIASQTAVLLEDEWLEAFWCDECQQTKWYRVEKLNKNSDKNAGRSLYSISLAPPQLWEQAVGVDETRGNPSVSEFTRRHSRMVSYKNL
ncbi:hypothetical protein [Calothrix sp. CCY 0018]|uniref:hypothetical protein n=1 Tax=Calothrix sp. CCY 0018 TaxID=3103864 RepID=UPI0039C6D498